MRRAVFRGSERQELYSPEFRLVALFATPTEFSSAHYGISLLKSVYGGYQANEYHQWFNEFAVNLQDKNSLNKLFRDPRQPIVVEATISFAESEVSFLKASAESLVQVLAWQEVTGQPVDPWTFSRMAVATQLRQLQPQLSAAIARLAGDVRGALEADTHELSLTIMPNGDMSIAVRKPAEAVFQAYEPDNLGVIEFHSASRSYLRQDVGGINLDSRAFEDQRRQQRLYNWQSKYQNVKTELATSYLKGMIARDSGSILPGEDLNATLIELFQTFFPDKVYEGVRPQAGGSLEFPVRLSTGEVHDIDEMSSGEKEILYGYLKLKNSTPSKSVILLDEPELHLNPSLLQGFTDFYYRHLGVSEGNQLWMVTHSDALLRQAVGNANYRVYHMVPASASAVSENQAVEVLVDDDVDRVTMDLVGDLASYRPHGKVVVLEGKVDNGFDVSMVRRLFPDFAKRVNLISGGHKRRVRDLYSVLRQSAVQSGTRNRFFAIVDKDSSPQGALDAGASEFSWDAYPIENYLLDAGCIRSALSTLSGEDVFGQNSLVLQSLKDCARELVDQLVMERLQAEVNTEFTQAISIKGSPTTSSPATDLEPSIAASRDRIVALARMLTTAELTNRDESYRNLLMKALDDNS